MQRVAQVLDFPIIVKRCRSSAVKAQERSLIINTLEATGGNQTKAANILGTTKRIIQYKITKLGIDPKLFRKGNKTAHEND